MGWLRGDTVFECAIVTSRKLFFSFFIGTLDYQLVVVLGSRTSDGGSSVFESESISMCCQIGWLHALACPFDGILGSNEVKLTGVDLDNVGLVGVAPDDASQAFEDKHGPS